MDRPRRARSIFPLCLILLLLSSSLFALPQKVLILHSGKPSEQTHVMEDGIRSVLTESDHLEIAMEYMDFQESSPGKYFEQLYPLYRTKFEHERFSVVITSGEAAVLFYLKYRDPLFPSSAMVFCGLDRLETLKGWEKKGFTGVVEDKSFLETLRLARSARPNASDLFIISDHAASASRDLQQLKADLRTLGWKANVVLLTNTTPHELETRLSQIPSRQTAVLLSYETDRNGSFVSPARLGSILRKSGTPVFGRSEWLMGMGLAGGECVSGRLKGIQAAKIAREILNGKTPADLPVITNNQKFLMADASIFKTFGIPLSILPQASLITNEPASKVNISRTTLFSMLSWLITLAGIILLLMVYFFQRQRMLKKLRKNEALLHAAFENIPFEFWATDSEGRYILLSREAIRQFGDLTGKKLEDLILDPEKKQLWKKNQDRVLKGETIDHVIETEREGKRSFYHEIIVPIRAEDQNLGFLGISIDISAQKTAEIELLKLNSDLEQRIAIRSAQWKSANENLILTNRSLQKTLKDLRDAQKQIVTNEKMAALGQLVAGIAHEINTPLGAIHSCGEQIIKTFSGDIDMLISRIHQLNEEEFRVWNKVLHEGINPHSTYDSKRERQILKEMKVILVRLGIPDPEENTERLFSLGILPDQLDSYLTFLKSPDITIQLRAVQKLIEINTSARIIKSASEKASQVIRALKNYTRQDSSDSFKAVNLAEELDNTLLLFTNQTKNNIIIKKLYETENPAFGQPDRLNQVWVNLISNALYAMRNEGELEIHIYEDPGWICVDITDYGAGIPFSVQKNLFQPFYTTKPPGEGTGLGLSISRQIVEQHGGEMSFSSEPGKTTFTVRLRHLPKNIRN